MEKPYFVYLLRCMDDSLYTGITTDVLRRVREHRSGGTQGAKYTKTHRPRELAAVWCVENRSAASKLEWRLKHLTKQQKELLCKTPELLSELLVTEEAVSAEPVKLLPR